MITILLPGEPIGKKVFSAADQLAFTALSFDINPLHTDPVEARRLITGKIVVHGIHVLMMALEYCTAAHWVQGRALRTGLKCDFKHAVGIGEEVVFYQEEIDPDNTVVRVFLQKILCLKITISTLSKPTSLENSHSVVNTHIVIPAADIHQPMEIDPYTCVGKNYQLAVRPRCFPGHFSHLRDRLGETPLSALCALSFFAGMIFPGRHSLLSTLELDISHGNTSPPQLFFSVIKGDTRFNLFTVTFKGAISGQLTAFQRPAPVQQPALTDFGHSVRVDEFKGTHSWVIGGSRGLGEFVAKILVMGGGDVALTYYRGEADAQILQQELNSHRVGACRMMRFNIAEDDFDVLGIDKDKPEVIYFFPTPKIFRKKGFAFDDALYREFHAIYVVGFQNLCNYLELHSSRRVTVFLPSTLAVEQPIVELAEYVKAKKEAEELAAEINQRQQKVFVVVARLPRLATDQTATLASITPASTMDTLLPIIRTLY